MASKAIKFLEEHQSESTSWFAEEAAWRKENVDWHCTTGLKRADLTARLGVSPQ